MKNLFVRAGSVLFAMALVSIGVYIHFGFWMAVSVCAACWLLMPEST